MLHIEPGPAALILFCTATHMNEMSVWDALINDPFLLSFFSLSLEREGTGAELRGRESIIIILNPL